MTVVVGGVGVRGTIKNVRRFEVHAFGPRLVRSNDDTCVPAAISNATSALYDEEAASKVNDFLAVRLTDFTTLKQLFSLVHRLPVGLEMRRVPRDKRNPFAENPLIGWPGLE